MSPATDMSERCRVVERVKVDRTLCAGPSVDRPSHSGCGASRGAAPVNARRPYFNRLMMCQPNGLAAASQGDTPMSPTFSRQPTSPKPFTILARVALVSG